MEKVTTIGIDLAKNVFQIHGVDKDGKVVLKKRVKRDNLLKVMKEFPPCLVGIEACGSAHYWDRQLKALGHNVKIMHPSHVKPYIGKGKNDERDAAGICEAVSRPKMLFVPAKDSSQQDIQSIHRIRSRLVESRTALVNQIRGLLAEYGIIFPVGIKHIRKELPFVLEDAENGLSFEFREMMNELYDELIGLDSKIKTQEARLDRLFSQNEACQRLHDIEGVGVLTATAMVAAVGDANVFKNGRQMAAWLGLTPRQHSSGEKIRLGKISKQGNNYVRCLLIHGARAVIRHCAKKEDKKSLWINDKVTRLGKNKATVALANKNARIIWAMLARKQDYIRAA